MARTPFVEAGRPDRGPSGRAIRNNQPGEMGAVDARLNQPDLDRQSGSTPDEPGSDFASERPDGARQLLSESTDLNSLMAAILGPEAAERIPVERVSAPRPIEQPPPVQALEPEPAPEPEPVVPWRQELEALLAEERRREVPAAPTPPPPAPAVARAPRVRAILQQLSARLPARPMLTAPSMPSTRNSIVAVSVLAVVILSLWAWQSGILSRETPPTPSPTTTASATRRPEAPGLNAGVMTSTDAPSAEPPSVGGAARRPAVPPSGSNTAANIAARVRTAPERPVPARGPAAAQPSPAAPVPGPVEALRSAPARDGSQTIEPTPAMTEAAVSPQAAATSAPPVTQSAAAAPSSTAPPVTSGNARGAVPSSLRVEPQVAAPSASAAPPPAVAPSPPVQRTQARVVNRAFPEYPNHLRRARIGGTVTVRMTVDAQGRVVDARSLDGPNALRPAAEAAARQWQYDPATVDGTTQGTFIHVTFNFNPDVPGRQVPR